MSIFDSAKEKLQELTESHTEQVEDVSDQVIERAGDAADEATDGKFAGQVDQAQSAADGAIGEA